MATKLHKVSLGLGLLVLTACTDHGVQSTPEGVVQKVLEVANSKKYEELSELCAPEADQGIQKICDLNDADEDAQAQFSTFVSKGRLGPSQIKGDSATVSLKGENGKDDGKVFLVKKKGRWYMVGSE